ncbi:MAG: transpeptidase family protein [Paludibacter sp.]|jgi:cell division protein FtsI (penicillin-binding protein 3)|nr:transpeptidase family protein [Paludibacter sp.]
MSEKTRKLLIRFGLVYFGFVLLFGAIIYKIVDYQFISKSKIMTLYETPNILPVPATRGNIYADDGSLMASSIYEYRIYMDTRAPYLRALGKDSVSVFEKNVDTLALSLSRFFGDRTPQEYKTVLMDGYNRKSGYLSLYPKRITAAQLREVKKMPLFTKGKNRGGLLTEENYRRVKPYGSLASRTIGDIYAVTDLDSLKVKTRGGKNGLELYFDSILAGTPGQMISHLYDVILQEPQDGLDVLTTINIPKQDIAEQALLEGVKQFGASEGYVILLDAHTAEVKAMVNLQRNADSTYTENKNGCVSLMTEPGSVFKVISLMALLDAGKAHLDDVIETGNGRFQFGRRTMTDHNANRGGYGTITLAQAIYASSNVGVSRFVYNAWGNNPAAYVDKLYSMKLNTKFDMGIPGTATPGIRHPKDKKYWSATTLPWMSVGYETQYAPIYTVAFYNAIANGGKYIQPKFVKALMKNGEIVEEYESVVLNPQICKPEVLQQVKETVLGVVEDSKHATAKSVHSDLVQIAGKTGTAQISFGKNGYTGPDGKKHYQVSFVGFFPYEQPKYTMIVVLRDPSIGIASGGRMCGSVFKKIAEKITIFDAETHVDDVKLDSLQMVNFMPRVKSGSSDEFDTVTRQLKLQIQKNDSLFANNSLDKGKMPDFSGMGAKDAVFVASQLGLRVHLSGKGKVENQDIQAGNPFKRGETVKLFLQ